MREILHVVSVEAVGDHSLLVSFNDGVTKQVNLRPLLRGPVFKPLLDPAFFAKVSIDPDLGVTVWPNDIDLAPEALHELPDEREHAA